MLWLTITGIRPYDGRYEFDIAGQELTTREWGWVKRHSGYLPLTLEEGFQGADPELFAVFAAIALRRAGRIGNHEVAEVFDRIADAPFGTTIRLEDDSPEPDEGDDAGPPVSSSNGSDSSSGAVSSVSSATSPAPPKLSGTPGSASSTSRPAGSGS